MSQTDPSAAATSEWLDRCVREDRIRHRVWFEGTTDTYESQSVKVDTNRGQYDVVKPQDAAVKAHDTLLVSSGTSAAFPVDMLRRTYLKPPSPNTIRAKLRTSS